MSRNCNLAVEIEEAKSVTPRRRCVSRNNFMDKGEIQNAVTPRRRCVSRNGLHGYNCRHSHVTPRRRCVSRNRLLEMLEDEENSHTSQEVCE